VGNCLIADSKSPYALHPRALLQVQRQGAAFQAGKVDLEAAESLPDALAPQALSEGEDMVARHDPMAARDAVQPRPWNKLL